MTAFERPLKFGVHFEERYGPTIVTRASAEENGRAAEFDEALDRFCEKWNLGTSDGARFEMEYVVAFGERR